MAFPDIEAPQIQATLKITLLWRSCIFLAAVHRTGISEHSISFNILYLKIVNNRLMIPEAKLDKFSQKL